MRVCVFAGASPAADAAVLQFGFEAGHALGRAGIGIVYGGGAKGMMGAVADGAIASGASVTGIVPQFLLDRETRHPGIADVRIVDSMHSRKIQMYDLSDGFLALPGAFGTLEETMEILTWKQLGLHAKPIVFLDRSGRWDPLKALFDRMVEDRFLSSADRALISFQHDLDETIRLFLASETL